MKNLSNHLIDTPYGKGSIDKLEVTELGYIKLKLYYEDQGVWHSWLLGNIGDLLKKEPSLKLIKND